MLLQTVLELLGGIGGSTQSLELTSPLFHPEHKDNDCTYSPVLKSDDIKHVNDFAVSEVCKAVNKPKSGKACGPDGVAPEAFKHGGGMLMTHLSLLFNMSIAHSFLPDSLFISGVPRVSGARGEDGNWRPFPSACQTGKRRRRSPLLLGVWDGAPDANAFGSIWV